MISSFLPYQNTSEQAFKDHAPPKNISELAPRNHILLYKAHAEALSIHKCLEEPPAFDTGGVESGRMEEGGEVHPVPSGELFLYAARWNHRMGNLEEEGPQHLFHPIPSFYK